MKEINKEDLELAKEVHYWAGRLIGHEQAYDIAEEIVNTIKSVEAKFNHVDLADVSKCDTFEQSKTSQHQGMCDNCRKPFKEH